MRLEWVTHASCIESAYARAAIFRWQHTPCAPQGHGARSEVARVRSRARKGLDRLEDINLRNKRDARSGSRKREINCDRRVAVLAPRVRKSGRIARPRPRNLRRLIDTRLHVIARWKGKEKKRRDNYCSAEPRCMMVSGKIYARRSRAYYDRPVVRKAYVACGARRAQVN